MSTDHRTQIRALDDEGLLRAILLVTRHPLFPDLALSAWERDFLWTLPEGWVADGSFSYKQRKIIRRTLIKTAEELERRKVLGDLKDEAAAVAAEG